MIVSFLDRLLRAPAHSLSKLFITGVLRSLSSPRARIPPFLHRVLSLLSRSSSSPSNLFAPGWLSRSLKNIALCDERVWASRVLSSSSLSIVYSSAPRLRLQHYLSIPTFPGMSLIVQARLNSLRCFGIGGYQSSFLCPCCNLLSSSPRLHFLILCPCPTLSQRRLSFSPRLPCFSTSLSPSSALSQLLLAVPPFCTNPPFIHAVGEFLLFFSSRRWR